MTSTTSTGQTLVQREPLGTGAVDWTDLVRGVLADPSRLRLVFQPIVSLQGAVVVGYEALSRFDGPPGLTPDLWFAAADEQGRGAELEALVVERCLALRSSLPSMTEGDSTTTQEEGWPGAGGVVPAAAVGSSRSL